MLRIALRNLWEHKLRTALLGVSIVGGVGFVVASFVFTDSLSAAFDAVFEGAAEGVDIVVAPVSEGGQSSAEAFPLIDAELADDILAVEGVEAVRPNLQGFVTVVTDEPSVGFAPDFVISWPEGESNLVLDGASPTGNQVVVDSGTAEAAGLDVGDTIELAGVSQSETFEIVGTFSFGEGGFGVGAGFYALDFDRAAELLGADGVTAFDVSVLPDADLGSVVAALDDVLPSEAEAIDARQAAEDQAAELQEGIGFFNTFILVFAGISLIVGAFVMYNAFRVVVAQRSRELALIRLLGTTRRQLILSVLSEAVIVGLVASVRGVAAGVLLAVAIRGLLESLGGSLPDAGLTVSPRTIAVGLAVGLATTLVAALLPALRTTRITPIEALRDQPELREVKPWWGIAGLALLLLSGGVIGAGITRAAENAALTGDSTPIILIGVGCLLLFGAMFMLARVLARPLVSLLGGAVRTTPGIIGRENARRTPRRTAVTSSSLMIGVGLVAMVAVLSQSVQDTIFDAVENTFASELLVQAAGFDPTAGIPREVAAVVEGTEGVERVGRINYLTIGVPGDAEVLAIGVEPETIELSFNYDEVQGSFDGLGPNTVAVQRVEADNSGWAIGDSIDLVVGGEDYEAEIVAIFDYSGEISDSQSYYLAYEEVARAQDRPLDGSLSVSLTEGADPSEVQESLSEALADFPTVQVQTLSDIIEQVNTGLNALLGMVAGLLVMSLIVAVVGIVLTLYLAVFERTRETGMLRAVGLTKRQTRRMIRTESIMIAVFGTVLGLVLGLVCGWALSIGVAGTGVSLGVPWVWIGAALVAALVTGMLAAIIPARRATRMDILEAIAYE